MNGHAHVSLGERLDARSEVVSGQTPICLRNDEAWGLLMNNERPNILEKNELDLDVQYNARDTVTVDRFGSVMSEYRSRTADAATILVCHSDIVYDDQSGQKMDIYGAKDDLRPVFVFIHGGYWRALSKEDSGFLAESLAAHGFVTVAIDYRLAPNVTLQEIVREVRASIKFLWLEGHRYGVDKNMIFVGGSSAGGHLAGCLLTDDWQNALYVPLTIIKGAVLISGLLDLRPLRRTVVQTWLNLTESDAITLSPALNLPATGCHIIVAYAEHDPDGFKWQSQEFHRLWQRAGLPSTLMKLKDRDHFDCPLGLGDEVAKFMATIVPH